MSEPFVVKHYSADERPCLKGNGFDGLEVGEDRAEAEAFVAWVNARLVSEQALRAALQELVRLYEEWNSASKARTKSEWTTLNVQRLAAWAAARAALKDAAK